MSQSLISPILWEALPFGEDDAFLDWLRQHDQWHTELAKQTRTRIILMDDLRQNLKLHAQVHDELATAYGVSKVGDLVSFDLSDRVSWQGFHFLHASDHLRLQQLSGL